jgi:hypothetical protein
MNKKYIKYINYIVNDIELPYLKYLDQYGLKQEEYELVLSKVFNQPVTIKGNDVYGPNHNKIYGEDSNGFWFKREYDQNNNKIYFEDSNGFWVNREYDINDNEIYYEDSDGDWYKQEFDSNGNKIYYEDSDGFIEDNR